MSKRPAPTSDGIPVATRKSRIAGFFLDWLAMMLPFAPFIAALISLLRGTHERPSHGDVRAWDAYDSLVLLGDLTWKFMVGGAIVVLVLLVYQVRLSLRGLSIGYRILGLRAVTKGTQHAPPAGRAFCRRWGYAVLCLLASLGAVFTTEMITQGVGYLLDLLLLVDFLWILGPARQCLHDKLTGTVVIRSPTLRDFAEAAKSP